MGYCAAIKNFHFMRPMPFFGFNCMPQMPMFPSLFGMFNPMPFSMPAINQNPWAMFGWQPSTLFPSNNFSMFNSMNFAMPCISSNPWTMLGWQPSFSLPLNNFSIFNQPAANLFSAKPINYFNNCTFNTIINNKNNTKIDSDNETKNNDGTPLNLSDKELTGYGFDTPEKRTGFRQLKPKMQRAVIELSDYAKSQGIKITYGSKRSIFRTYAEQEAIYRTARPGYAAKPGNSRHESGEAVDITIPGANKNNKNDPQYRKLAQKWQSMGYTWGGNWSHCEPWHFDLRKAS